MTDEDEDAPPLPDEPPPLPDEPPPLPEGLPPEVATEATSSTAPVEEPPAKSQEAASRLSGSAVAGGHTPESIARLPPKLRQRLVQRGILKEEDVNLAMSAVQGAASSISSPPDPPATPTNITGAVVKAAAPAPTAPAVTSAAASLAWAQAAAARVNEDLARIAMAKAAAAVTKAAQPKVMAPMSAPAVPKQPVQHPGVSQQVYSAAPVICKEAVLKRPPEEVLEVSEARRSKMEVSSSPAEVRAAAARAEGQEAPVWVYETKEAVAASAAPPVAVAAVSTAAESPPEVKAPPPAPEATGPPLPPGWVRVPHEGDHYYWNTQTNEVSWEHPAEQAQKPKGEKKPKFTEEHKVLWTDIGKIIGRQGMNLKIIKASIGCDIHIPKQDSGSRDDKKDGKGKGKDGKGKKDAKGKSKGKRDAEGNKIGRGIGDGSTKLADDQFCTVTVTGDTALKANGGKRCIQIMLGYGRNVERALADLGVEAKMPSLEEMTDGKSKQKKDEIDPMDPASYSDAPVGNWSAGLKKPGQKAPGGGNLPRDSKQANAERF